MSAYTTQKMSSCRFLTGGDRLPVQGTVSVTQTDLNGVVIASYDSIVQASNETNIAISNISLAVNDKRHTAGDYRWERT